MQQFLASGYKAFPHDPRLAQWISAARPIALALAADKTHQDQWLRCNGTWFVGVNLLPNSPNGAVAGSGVLAGQVIDFIFENMTVRPVHWDRAQVSVCYQGYPRQGAQDSDAAFRFRQNRDAAHLDGLLRHGPQNARKLSELHQFILGLPLTDSPPDAAPFVIWEGSHKIIRNALQAAFAGLAPEHWADTDITALYQQTRREIFETCRRVTLPARPGEAYLVHRMALHGVAPWPDDLKGPVEGRAIAYFRPDFGTDAKAWLALP